MNRFRLVPICFLLCQTLVSQSPIEKAIVDLDLYSRAHPPEKIYGHTDRDLYTPGDTLWFKTYLVNGLTHIPGVESQLIHVEVYDEMDSLVMSSSLHAPEGTVGGDFILKKDMRPGTYYFRAYTEYMRNWDEAFYFVKSFQVWNPIAEESGQESKLVERQTRAILDDTKLRPELSIYPEGGDLIAGLKSKVAVKFESNLSETDRLQGFLQNGEGEILQELKFYERGLSSFDLIPQNDESYSLKIDLNDVTFNYPLPMAMDDGFVLNLTNRGSKLIVNISSSYGQEKSANVIAHIRGAVIWNSEIQFDQNGAFVAILPKEGLPEGVVHFTVFDEVFRPYCERLTFVENKQINVDVKLNAESFVVQQEAEISIDVLRRDYVSAEELLDCSISVFNYDASSSESSESNIRTYLLLNSDLHGKINDPAYFFKEENAFKRSYLLDLLMMTKGWRRFTWRDVFDNPSGADLLYAPVKGIKVTGWTGGVVNLKKPVKSRLIYTAMDENFYEEEKVTDEQGRFEFGPFVSFDTIKCIIQARRYDEKTDSDKLDGKRNVMIYLDEREPVTFSSESIRESLDFNYTTPSKKYLERERLAYYNTSQQSDMMQVEMDELVVSAKKKTLNDSLNVIAKELSYYGEPSNRIVPDDNDFQGMQTVFDMLRTVPGVRVNGSAPNQTVTIRGVGSINASTTPLYLVNGMMTDEASVNIINPYEVKFIDVLKDGRTAIFGSRGANGVIAIYTGRDMSSSRERKPGIVNFKLNGFYVEREFSSPQRSYEFRNGGIADNRKTLLWKSDLTLVEGKKTIKFICSDRVGDYKVVLNGISATGEPVYAEGYFRVE